MKKTMLLLVGFICILIPSILFLNNRIWATPITINSPFHFRENRSANSVGLTEGEYLHFGAMSVSPNGANGTSGSAKQGFTIIPLNFLPFSVAPNFFSKSISYDSNLTGQWEFTFINGSDNSVVLTPSVGAAIRMLFPSNVVVSGSGFTPTLSWTVPQGITIDGVRIQIWDLQTLISTLFADVIHVAVLNGNLGSYTLPAMLSTGKSLQEGHLYSIEISLAQTRGVPLSGNNATLLSRSRTFFNFVPLSQGSPPNVFLPIVTPGPSPVYTFGATVVQGQTIFIDPKVAVGYDYTIGSGNPNFASVSLPTGIGDNQYDLYLHNGTDYVFVTQLTGGVEHIFNTGGVDKFRILGIETSAMLNPEDGTAFITGLTFTNDGEFTGTMTAITKDLIYLPLITK